LYEAIEKRGFTNIGAAYDGHCEAVADDASIGIGLLKGGERGFDRCDLRGDLILWEEVNIVFGEVDASLQRGDEAYKLLFYRAYLA